MAGKQDVLVMQLLEAAGGLQDKVGLCKIQGHQASEAEIRYVISFCCGEGYFQVRPVLENDGYFSLAIRGLTEKGEKALEKFRLDLGHQERTMSAPETIDESTMRPAWSFVEVTEATPPPPPPTSNNSYQSGTPKSKRPPLG